jgi:hypothetical protein
VQIAALTTDDATILRKETIALTPVKVGPNQYTSRTRQRQKAYKQHHYTTEERELPASLNSPRLDKYDNRREHKLDRDQGYCH